MLPAYNHAGDAALDLRCSGQFVIGLENQKEEISSASFPIQPGERIIAKTGIRIALPKGCWGNIRGRSGLAVNDGLITLAGVIDQDYRGEVGVVLYNLSKEPIDIKKYEKIGQLIVQEFVPVKVIHVDELDGTERGHNGFGSSGKK